MTLVPYVAPLVAASALSIVFIVVAAGHRGVPGVRWFIAFEAALAIWTLGYAAEIAAPGLEGKLLAAKVQYAGIVLVGITWLGFTTEYSGLTWWSARNTLLAMVVPALTLILAWTNEAHGLLLSSVALTTGEPYTVLDLGRGPWFWVLVIYSYACLLLALLALSRVVMTRPAPFRTQAGVLLVASLFPWVGNVLYLTGRSALDLTVFGFVAAGLGSAWAVFRSRLLSLGPIGRDTIVEGMSEAVAVIDPEGRVVDVNPAALRVLGTEAERVVGWSAAEALGPFAPELSREGPTRRTVPGLAGERSYDCQVNPLRDARGRHRGWTLVLHDVTERAAEAEALRRAREAAEELALAQRAFLANMNHELRTPLNGVMGMLQVLLQSELDEERKGYAEMAYASAEDLLALVDRILDFSALEMGRIDLVRVPFELVSVVRGSVDAVQKEAVRKGLGLSLEAGPELPPRVVGDPTRVGRVLTALLSNAVKFTDRGRVQVTAAVASRGGDSVRVRIEVRDTGVGIPAHRIGAIFQGFVQADASSTRRQQGAGIGLTIAHRLVERMGGTLEVASQEGRGSTFTAELPFELVPARATEVS